MADGLKIIVDFVEGRLLPKEFEKLLYEEPDIERVLSEDPNLPRGTNVGTSTYLFAIQQDFNDPGGIRVHSQKVAYPLT